MLLSDLVDLIKKGNSNFISVNIFEDLNIDDAASLDAAVKHQISFLEENNILKEKLDQTKASAIITTNNDEIVSALKKLNISNIIVKNPRIAFAEVSGHWPGSVLEVSRYYPPELDQILDYEVLRKNGRWELLWFGNRIAVYQAL